MGQGGFEVRLARERQFPRIRESSQVGGSSRHFRPFFAPGQELLRVDFHDRVVKLLAAFDQKLVRGVGRDMDYVACAELLSLAAGHRRAAYFPGAVGLPPKRFHPPRA